MATVNSVATRTAMAALASPATDQIVYLTEVGREGPFRIVAGTAPSDPQQGLYVPSNTSGYYYARIWDQINGKPEWFGAVTNGPDCLTALQAAVVLCPVTLLANDDYYISTTLKINTPERKLVGERGRGQSRGVGTRLIVSGATADTLQIGPDTAPSSINNFTKDITVSSMTLTRSAAPSMSAQNVSQPTGLRVKYVLNAAIDQIFSTEHAIGFYLGGVVGSRLTDCRAFRSTTGTGSVDFWYGHYLDGTLTGVGAGGNASVYLYTCVAEFAGTVSGDVIGLVANGAFVDSFIRDFESSLAKKGILITGTGSSGGEGANIDLHIDHPVLDACSDRCIEISAVSPGGIVSVIDPYTAVTGPSALACIHVHNGGGSVKVLGGQAIAFVTSEAGGNALGFLGESQTGIVVDRLSIVNSKRPVGLTSCTDADIIAEIENRSVVATEGAVFLATSSRVRVVSKITGGAAVFPAGVELSGTGNSRVLIDWTRINDSAVSGGATNRLKVNGSAVTNTGSFTGGVAMGA